MSRYSKRHYEDVAHVLHFRMEDTDGPSLYVKGGNDTVCQLAKDFADLFAADNPPICSACGTSPSGGQTLLCSNAFGAVTGDTHTFEGSFDCDRFLAACGLEPKGPFDDCPLCGKPTEDGHAHKECADYEQAMADAEAEALYNHTVRGDN